MEELLEKLKIIQKKKVKKPIGSYTYRRLSPYHPLSYVVFIMDNIIGTLLYGFVGYWDGFKNPFRWR